MEWKGIYDGAKKMGRRRLLRREECIICDVDRREIYRQIE